VREHVEKHQLRDEKRPVGVLAPTWLRVTGDLLIEFVKLGADFVRNRGDIAARVGDTRAQALLRGLVQEVKPRLVDCSIVHE
jgi:hypothetical protein